jgi:mono/diheme cytochrome c family protein
MSDAPSSPGEAEPGSRLKGPEATDVSAMHAAISREASEPREGYEPVSLGIVVFIGIVLFWGGYYLASFHANFNPTILDTRYPTPIPVSPTVAAPSPEVLGNRTYNMACLPCHQADGEGVPGQFPPLAGSEWVISEGHGRLVRIILNGLQGPITVRGQVYNNVMPPWRDNLTDEQIAAVSTYVRNQWGNRASSVAVEEVAAIRQEDAGRTTPWTAEELLKLPETN